MADRTSIANAPPAGRPERRQDDRNHAETLAIAFRRDRLLSSLIMIMVLGLMLAVPFALQAGSAFFMPLTAGVVFGMILVPLQLRLEALHLPSTLAATISIMLFILFVAGIGYVIVMPALDWINTLPARISTLESNVQPIIDLFDTVDESVEKISDSLGVEPVEPDEPETLLLAPQSVMEIVTGAAPSAIVQIFFALLIMVFFLATFRSMRSSLVRAAKTVAGGEKAQHILDDLASGTGSYMITVSIINIVLGIVVALVFWQLGMGTPWMWGGLAALVNFVPYVGPVAMFGLAAVGGLSLFPDPLSGMLPALSYVAINIVEAYVLTPLILGKRFTINPLLIMIALSFWGWIWGVVGALISVPLLILGKIFFERVGSPDIAGFLLDQTTLVGERMQEKLNVDIEPRLETE